MEPTMSAHVEVMDLVAQMKSAEQPFVLATVVRTVSVTAAKAGAKAIIRPDGTIVAGWIGGGCARGAVLKAAREALLDGEPRMVSVQPENLLAELGVKPGDHREGIRFASNMCRRAPWISSSNRCCILAGDLRKPGRCRWPRRQGSAITSRWQHCRRYRRRARPMSSSTASHPPLQRSPAFRRGLDSGQGR
jgi:hypothetical protein